MKELQRISQIDHKAICINGYYMGFGEDFTLKEMEDMILGAEDKLVQLEYELFRQIREQIGENVVRIQKTAKAIAKADVFASLALVSEQNHYCRPKLNESGKIDIKGGRHPVVEKMITNDNHL